MAENDKPSPARAADSYIHSHTAPEKGVDYDRYYEESPWLRYSWGREQAVLHKIVRTFYPDRPPRLLDFACGTGRILSALEDRVQSATGVDVSEPMLNEARRKLRRSQLVHKNILQDEDPFHGEKFDLITAFRFFVNAEPELRRQALLALAKLMAPNGYFVFNNHHNYHSLRRSSFRLKARLKGEPFTQNLMTHRQCVEMIEKAGLKLVATYSVGFLYVPKIDLPFSIYRLFDTLAGNPGSLAALSEGPILVCRKVAA